MAAALAACTSAPPGEPAKPVAEVAVPAAPPTPADFYRAVAGDSVASVASRFSLDPALLAKWNGLPGDAVLNAGELVRIAPVKATEPRPPASACPPPSSADASARPLIWPVDGPVASGFGSNRTKGVVISGALGDPVKAARAGRVIYAGNKIEGYGNLIVIKHDAHLLTAYGSNRRILVKEGASVQQGQVIAEMGDQVTGKPALVFEVRENRVATDPMKFLPVAACAAQK